MNDHLPHSRKDEIIVAIGLLLLIALIYVLSRSRSAVPIAARPNSVLQVPTGPSPALPTASASAATSGIPSVPNNPVVSTLKPTTETLRGPNRRHDPYNLLKQRRSDKPPTGTSGSTNGLTMPPPNGVWSFLSHDYIFVWDSAQQQYINKGRYQPGVNYN